MVYKDDEQIVLEINDLRQPCASKKAEARFERFILTVRKFFDKVLALGMFC